MHVKRKREFSILLQVCLQHSFYGCALPLGSALTREAHAESRLTDVVKAEVNVFDSSNQNQDYKQLCSLLRPLEDNLFNKFIDLRKTTLESKTLLGLVYDVTC